MKWTCVRVLCETHHFHMRALGPPCVALHKEQLLVNGIVSGAMHSSQHFLEAVSHNPHNNLVGLVGIIPAEQMRKLRVRHLWRIAQVWIPKVILENLNSEPNPEPTFHALPC